MELIKKQAAKAIILRITDGNLELLTFKYLDAPNPEKSLNKMALPGGKLDETDVDMIAGLKREVAEETGAEIKTLSNDSLGSFSFTYFKGDSTIEVTADVFVAIQVGGDLYEEERRESTSILSAPSWIRLEDIKFDDFIHDEAPFVMQVLEKAEYYKELVMNNSGEGEIGEQLNL